MKNDFNTDVLLITTSPIPKSRTGSRIYEKLQKVSYGHCDIISVLYNKYILDGIIGDLHTWYSVSTEISFKQYDEIVFEIDATDFKTSVDNDCLINLISTLTTIYLYRENEPMLICTRLDQDKPSYRIRDVINSLREVAKMRDQKFILSSLESDGKEIMDYLVTVCHKSITVIAYYTDNFKWVKERLIDNSLLDRPREIFDTPIDKKEILPKLFRGIAPTNKKVSNIRHGVVPDKIEQRVFHRGTNNSLLMYMVEDIIGDTVIHLWIQDSDTLCDELPYYDQVFVDLSTTHRIPDYITKHKNVKFFTTRWDDKDTTIKFDILANMLRLDLLKLYYYEKDKRFEVDYL